MSKEFCEYLAMNQDYIGILLWILQGKVCRVLLLHQVLNNSVKMLNTNTSQTIFKDILLTEVDIFSPKLTFSKCFLCSIVFS